MTPRTGAAERRRTLRFSLLFSLGVLLALYLAGGWRPYVNAPAGFHYGINSPLDALTLLLPPGWRVLTQQGLLILRATAAGGVMCWYLMRHYGCVSRLFAPMCAGYAAAVYTGCIINLVWVDAATLLPLMLDAADVVLNTGRLRRLFVLTFVCVAVNCYTAWPLCLYCLFYIIWQFLRRPGRMDWPGFAKAVWNGVKAMLPGLLAAFLLLSPVIWAQYQSDAFHLATSGEEFGFAPMELIYCLFFGRYSSACAAAGMPYLYIGSIVLMLALLYFMGNDSTRAKFAGAFLLAGVGASYLVNLPGLTWQNGDDLAVFPFRYGFLLSAMLLILAADTVIHDPPPISSLAAAMFVLAIYLLGYHGTVGTAARTWRLAIGGGLYLACCPLLRMRAQPSQRRAAGILLAVLMLADAVVSSCITLYGVFLWI